MSSINSSSFPSSISYMQADINAITIKQTNKNIKIYFKYRSITIEKRESIFYIDAKHIFLSLI